ncbi:unnamed protein product [Brachionus calyciflorus]|uniref:Uncharacterized protein n=1 Tax=Brachionus calyciflorus TaxID=104777 RepID=A0A814GKZ1_9BILA|nr:unnamed protein product [Brachionus calyciflorus]
MLLIFLPFLFYGSIHTWHCSEQCMLDLRNDAFCYKTDTPLNINDVKNCYFSIERTTRVFHIEAPKRDYNVKEIYDFNFLDKTVTIFEIYDTFLHIMPNVSKLNIENFALKRTGLAILDRNSHLPDTLEYMDLSENSITFIKEDFFIKFQNLKEIILSKNFFVQIDLIVFNSNTLYLIDLSHNTHLSELNEIKFITSPDTDLLEINLQVNSLKKIPYFIGISKIYKLNIKKQHKDFFYSNNSLLISKTNDQLFEIHSLIISLVLPLKKTTGFSLEYLCFFHSNRFKTQVIYVVDVKEFLILRAYQTKNESEFADLPKSVARKGTKMFRLIHEEYTPILFNSSQHYCNKYMLDIKITTTLKTTTTHTQSKTSTTKKSSITTTTSTTTITTTKTTTTKTTTKLSTLPPNKFENTTIQILPDISRINLIMRARLNNQNNFRNRILDYFMDNISRIVVIFTFIFASLLGIFFWVNLAIEKSLKLRKENNIVE